MVVREKGEVTLMSSQWIVLCPGRSLADAKVVPTDRDMVIAVNAAVLYPRCHVDIWAVQDIEVFESMWQLIAQGASGITRGFPCLWIPARWEEDIPARYPHMAGFFSCFEHQTFPGVPGEANACVPFSSDINWREYTMFMAIARAVIGGAREIRIYGADHCGQGYFLPGMENNRTLHTPKRWADEAAKFARVVEVCAAFGISVTQEAST